MPENVNLGSYWRAPLRSLFNYFLHFLEYLKNAFATSKCCALGTGRVKPFFCLHVFYSRRQDHIQFEANFLIYKNNLFDLHDKSIEWGSINY